MAVSLSPLDLPADIDTMPPAAVLAWLASRGACLSVHGDKLLLTDLRPVADPPPHAEALAVVRRRKADLLTFLRADRQPTPTITAVTADCMREVADTLARATRVGVEFAVVGYHGTSPTPYRAQAARLVLATDPHTVLAFDPRTTNVLRLRGALAGTDVVGWGPDCARLGLLALMLIQSHRPVTGVVPGAGLVIGDDDAAIATAGRRATAALAGPRCTAN